MLIIKRESKRTLNPNNIGKYKRDILNSYNAFVKHVNEQWSNIAPESQSSINKGFEENYNRRFLEALHFIGFHIDLPTDGTPVNIDNVVEYTEDATGGVDDPDDNENKTENEPGNGNGNTKFNEFVDDFGPNAHKTTPYPPKKAKFHTFTQYRDPKEFDQMYSLDPSRIAANRNASNRARSSNVPNNQNYFNRNHFYANPNGESSNSESDDDCYDGNYHMNRYQNEMAQNPNEISAMKFYNLCARTFTEMYSGDPMALRPFIHKIDMVYRRCQNIEHEKILIDHIMSSVKDIASDILPMRPDSVEQIKTILRAK